MKWIQARWVLFAICLIPLVSCSKCEKGDGQKLTGLLPGNSTAVLVLPNLAVTIQDCNDLVQKFSVGPISTFVNQAKLELSRRLGFDPLQAEQWKKIGIDPGQGVAFSFDAQENPMVALGVSDNKIFEEELKKRFKDLLGANQFDTVRIDGVDVRTIGLKVGERTLPWVHYAMVGRYAIVGFGAKPETLVKVVHQKPEESLASAPWYNNLVQRIPPGSDLIMAAQGEAARKQALIRNSEWAAKVKDGLVLAVNLAKEGLSARIFLGLTPEAAKSLTALTDQVVDAHLERYLPDETILAVKARISPAKLLELVLANEELKSDYNQLMSNAQTVLQMNAEAPTMRNLTGNFAMGISLSKPQLLSQALRKNDQEKISKSLRLQSWIQLGDLKSFVNFLDKALATIPADQATQVRGSAGPLGFVSIKSQSGFDGRIVYGNDLTGLCLGEGCERQAEALLAGKSANLLNKVSPETKALLTEPSLLVFYLNFDAILQALSSFDASAFGDGGMFMKMILDMAVTAVRNLKELTGVVQFLPEGVVLSGHLKIQ